MPDECLFTFHKSYVPFPTWPAVASSKGKPNHPADPTPAFDCTAPRAVLVFAPCTLSDLPRSPQPRDPIRIIEHMMIETDASLVG